MHLCKLENQVQPNGNILRNNWLIYTGVWIAFISIIATSWSQWRTSSVQHALSALQNLRTDREYLICAMKVNASLNNAQTEITQTQLDEILARKSNEKIESPSFSDASLFILNQYEFLAASAKLGAMDIELLNKTVRGLICYYVPMYAPLLKHLRKTSPTTYENLVWLYREFSGDFKVDLGDFDRIPKWLQNK